MRMSRASLLYDSARFNIDFSPVPRGQNNGVSDDVRGSLWSRGGPHAENAEEQHQQEPAEEQNVVCGVVSAVRVVMICDEQPQHCS